MEPDNDEPKQYELEHDGLGPRGRKQERGPSDTYEPPESSLQPQPPTLYTNRLNETKKKLEESYIDRRFLIHEQAQIPPEVREKRWERLAAQMESPPEHFEMTIKGERLIIETRQLDALTPEERDQRIARGELPLFAVAGAGGSLEQLHILAAALAAREEKQVNLLSLPGYGGSSQFPKSWLDEKTFAPEAEIIHGLISQWRSHTHHPDLPISLLGFSQGTIVTAETVHQFPDDVRDLILLHPAGTTKENWFMLTVQFFKETFGSKTIAMILERLKDPGYQENLSQMIGIQKKMLWNGFVKAGFLAPLGFQAHMSRAPKIAGSGRTTELLKAFMQSPKKNLAVVGGQHGYDRIAPPRTHVQNISEQSPSRHQEHISYMLGADHFAPVEWDAIYAALIGHHLDRFANEQIA